MINNNSSWGFHLKFCQNATQTNGSRDRLFATLSSLKSRLFTGLTCLAHQFTRLIGRIKHGFRCFKVETTAQAVFGKSPPTGFRNYGNSCWLASGMQVLLASEQFETIVRAPLKPTEIDLPTVRDSQGKWICPKREETAAEYALREKLQKALIEIIETSKRSNQEAMTEALRKFHQCAFEGQYPQMNKFVAIGEMGNPYTLFELVSKLFPEDILLIFQRKPSMYLNPDSLRQSDIEWLARFGFRDERPQICIFLLDKNQKLQLNQQIDLSNHFRDGIYKVFGIPFSPFDGHIVGLVRHQNQSYICNDEHVTRVSMEVNPADFKGGGDIFIAVEIVTPAIPPDLPETT